MPTTVEPLGVAILIVLAVIVIAGMVWAIRRSV